MRVRKHHRGGISPQGLLHHFARVYGGAVEGGPEELNEFDHPMSVVEKDAAEGFEFTRSESQGQKITGGLGRREGAATAYAARELLACRSDDFLCRGGYGLAGTAEREQWFGVRHRRSPGSGAGLPATRGPRRSAAVKTRAPRDSPSTPPRRAQVLDGENGVGGLISRQARPSLLSDLF